ncbi:MAG: response regulator [Bacteriovoracaceae bacterium]|nr:response regulator [Bacteriovoracaceae bacterium]
MMALLHFLEVESSIVEIFLDGLLLSIFSSPFIYYFLINKILFKNHQLVEDLIKQKKLLDITALVSKTDTKGIITYANDTFCELSKYSRQELIGRSHNIVSSGIHSKVFWKGFWDTIRQGETFKGEICNKAKDGSLYWVQATIFPIFDSDKKITGYSGVRVNITDRKETERQMVHQSKLASIGEMAAGVGHEINNPLTISIGNIALMKKELKKDNYEKESIFDKLKKIEHGHERIRKIVDGLRTYSRSDTNHNEVISMREAIDQTVNLISEIYEKEGVVIIRENPDRKLFTRGSLGKLQQIVMNLISNAKDATEGQDKREIHLSLEEIGSNSLVFSVRDNGCGISDDNMNQILNPFFTTKEIGKGTGMGLGLVNELTKKLNGKLSIESTVNEGSLFSITLPSKSDSDFEQQQQQQQNNGKLKGVALIVDDEKAIRELLVNLLEDLGLEVDEADDGDTALEKVKNKRYDYICTDMKMQRMQGEEFINKARKLPNGDTGFFIVTGGVTTNYSEKKRAELWNIADGYIKKPFTEESLYNVLSKYKKP